MAKKRLKKVQKLWLEALRSGKYKQGKGRLRHGDKFCCLGVACDLYIKEKKIAWEKQNNSENYFEIYDNPGCLPDKIKDWLGMYSPRGSFRGDLIENVSSLISMNDNEGSSFKRIANVIDDNRETIFK